jgi:hypothetical protein
VTDEQRDTETPGQARTLPLLTCQPTAGTNCAGSKRCTTADAASKRCMDTREADIAATTTAMSNERLMLNGTFGSIGSVPNLSTTRDALLAVRDVASGNNWECHTDAVAGVCLSRRGGRCARCGVRE